MWFHTFYDNLIKAPLSSSLFQNCTTAMAALEDNWIRALVRISYFPSDKEKPQPDNMVCQTIVGKKGEDHWLFSRNLHSHPPAFQATTSPLCEHVNLTSLTRINAMWPGSSWGKRATLKQASNPVWSAKRTSAIQPQVSTCLNSLGWWAFWPRVWLICWLLLASIKCEITCCLFRKLV